jgi:hypothetical protein
MLHAAYIILRRTTRLGSICSKTLAGRRGTHTVIFHPNRQSWKHEPTLPGTFGSSAVSSRTDLIDFVVPRNRYGNSIFSTPVLLFFRLFFQATGIQRTLKVARKSRAVNLGAGALWFLPIIKSSRETRTQEPCVDDIDLSDKFRPHSWLSALKKDILPISSTARVHSISWIKSLSAPLSHEYIQFVALCPRSERTFRIIAERDANGDSVFVLASKANTPNSNIKQVREHDEQHDLPLPLISLCWSHLPLDSWPTVLELARVLHNVGHRRPKYNIMREHCWWFAEAVIDEMLAHRDVLVKEWPWASYRYSYIVLGKKILRRDVLLQAAREFREAMDKDGAIEW